MKKLAQRFCFGGILAALVATVFLSGCSKRPTAQPQQPGGNPAPAAQQQPSGQPGTPAAQAVPSYPKRQAPPGAAMSTAKNFYFVFDGSGSMQGRKIEEAKTAVKEMLKNIGDDVNLGLWVFDRYGNREVIALGAGNKQKFIEAIDAVKADEGTPLGSAIANGVEALAQQRAKQLDYGEYRLVVITDGEADWSDPVEKGTKPAAVEQIPIYTIGFHTGSGHSLFKYSVFYKSANSLDELRKALEEVSAELDVFDPQSFKK